MKRTAACSILLVFLVLLIPLACVARTIEPIVSTDWLAEDWPASGLIS